MVIFENQFISMDFDENKNLFIEDWKPTSEDMTNEDWKETRIELMNACLKYKFDKILSLGNSFYFIIIPELQKWLAETISPKINHLVEKVAITIPPEMFAHISVEQLMEEDETSKVSSQYFDNKDNAINWLIEK